MTPQMAEEQSQKRKTIVLPDSVMIARLQAETAKHRRRLKETQEAVTEDEEALRVASRKKEVVETQLSRRRRSLDDLERRATFLNNTEHSFGSCLTRQITFKIQRCSAQLLKPIVHDLQAKLPYEIREMIYEYLMDTKEPRVVPSSEVEKPSSPSSPYGNHDPFNNESISDPAIMGTVISNEMKHFFISKSTSLIVAKTTFYFRGSKRAQRLVGLLDTRLPFHKQIRDVIRHLRVYLRCETFDEDVKNFLDRLPPDHESQDDRENHGERHMYDTYRRSLTTLQDLPYKRHKIKLELCMFHNFCSTWATDSENKRKMYNTLEAIKPTYFFVKNTGADVTVRCEDFRSGEGMDVTWEFDLDAEAWDERQEANYTFYKKDDSPSRTEWMKKIAIACDAGSKQAAAANISWKHGLFDGSFSACCCKNCKAFNGLFDSDLGCDLYQPDCEFDFDAFLHNPDDDAFGGFEFHHDDFNNNL